MTQLVAEKPRQPTTTLLSVSLTIMKPQEMIIEMTASKLTPFSFRPSGSKRPCLDAPEAPSEATSDAPGLLKMRSGWLFCK